ncbi:hypothetical protein E5S67_04353 [Microcoleus sp. IPMA8]|uniref:Uncharacterized protein n=1 Tax=Microcoleus asticus IPMA8 TaxID=2563858 RepID=A0ABX2D346_9CYAN|nr:hypothetical protein [Microcoleus asticus IPMA8]
MRVKWSERAEGRSKTIILFLFLRSNKLQDMGLELAYSWIILGNWYKKLM